MDAASTINAGGIAAGVTGTASTRKISAARGPGRKRSRLHAPPRRRMQPAAHNRAPLTRDRLGAAMLAARNVGQERVIGLRDLGALGEQRLARGISAALRVRKRGIGGSR
jgi:hypothetical protein